MNSMKSSASIKTAPPLTGSWRTFSPRLDQRVAERFRQIEEGTLEALREAATNSRVMETSEEPPMKRP